MHGTGSALHPLGVCVSGVVGIPTCLASLPSSVRIWPAGKRLATWSCTRDHSAAHRDELHICQPLRLCLQDQPRLVAKLLLIPSNSTSVEMTQQRQLLLGARDRWLDLAITCSAALARRSLKSSCVESSLAPATASSDDPLAVEPFSEWRVPMKLIVLTDILICVLVCEGISLIAPDSSLLAKIMRFALVVSHFLFVFEKIVAGWLSRILENPAGLKFDTKLDEWHLCFNLSTFPLADAFVFVRFAFTLSPV